jgi:hypothetical protein
MNLLSLLKGAGHNIKSNVAGAVNEINPFDGGKTFAQPQTTKQRLQDYLKTGGRFVGQSGGDRHFEPNLRGSADRMPVVQAPGPQAAGNRHNFSGTPMIAAPQQLGQIYVAPSFLDSNPQLQGNYNSRPYEDGSAGTAVNNPQVTGDYYHLQNLYPADRLQYGNDDQTNTSGHGTDLLSLLKRRSVLQGFRVI